MLYEYRPTPYLRIILKGFAKGQQDKSLSPRELVTGTIELASLPEVFLRVNEMIDSTRYTAADIGHVISRDPGLTARLLKLANSAFYIFPSQIDTVSRAITIIGTRELRDLILATSVARIFKGLPNDLITMDDFWRHSVCCGLAARNLAAQRGERLEDRFFVAGLLHDIGSLLIYRKVPELAREALLRCQHNDIPLYRAEQDVLGFDHAAVGAEILRKWKLPEQLQEVVECHHMPGHAGRFPRDTALVHIADVVAEAMQYGSAGDPRVPPMDPAAWRLAELSDNNIADVMEEVERQFAVTLYLIVTDPAPSVASIHRVDVDAVGGDDCRSSIFDARCLRRSSLSLSGCRGERQAFRQLPRVGTDDFDMRRKLLQRMRMRRLLHTRPTAAQGPVQFRQRGLQHHDRRTAAIRADAHRRRRRRAARRCGESAARRVDAGSRSPRWARIRSLRRRSRVRHRSRPAGTAPAWRRWP